MEINLVEWYARQTAKLRYVYNYRPSQLMLGSLIDHTNPLFWDWGNVWRGLGNK